MIFVNRPFSRGAPAGGRRRRRMDRRVARLRWAPTVLGVLLAAARLFPAWATVEENELAAHLASEAAGFLDQLLGPGRSKVLVTVEAERSETRTQSEFFIPIRKPSAEADKASEARVPKDPDLPGYMLDKLQTPKKPQEAEMRKEDERNKDQGIDYYQKDQEQSLRSSGLIVKRLRATVVLDTTVPESQINAVRRLLPDLLRMNGDRGDEMSVLRAPLVAPWKRLLMSYDGMRTTAVLAAAALITLWLSVTAYLIAMRVVKTFVRELAARRADFQAPPQAAPPFGAFQPQGAQAELGQIGGFPSLSEPEGAPAQAHPARALGRRFDFLSGQDPQEAAEMLSREPPEDLALLFGYLADSNPELSSRLFAALPIALQGEVSHFLVRLTLADPERLAMLESRLKSAVEFGIRGPDRLGQILSRLAPGQREELLSDLMSRDTAEAEQVERSLFPFESIAELPAVDLRRLLTHVPYQEWGTALRGAPERVAEAVLAQLPAGTRDMVREALDVPQPRDKILEARSKILTQAFSLAEQGVLKLGRRGGSPELL